MTPLPVAIGWPLQRCGSCGEPMEWQDMTIDEDAAGKWIKWRHDWCPKEDDDG